MILRPRRRPRPWSRCGWTGHWLGPGTAEADELYTEIHEVFERLFGTHHRFADRRDPKLRPADAIPVEFVLMAYPVLDLPPLPETDEDDEAGSETGPDG